jgi:hypothetical protein
MLKKRKYLLTLSISAILLILLLTGCNFTNSVLPVLPDDSIIPGSGMYEYDEQFVAIINQLTTPQKICQYMKDNFTYDVSFNAISSPYEFYLEKRGACGDYSNFAAFVAYYHGYQAYQITIRYYFSEKSHRIAAYKMSNSYTYSDNSRYINESFPNFREIVVDDQTYHYNLYAWSDYTVHSWDLSEKIEEVDATTDTGDWVEILSVTPNSGLIDGVDTKFKIVVEYNLVSVIKAHLQVGFNNADDGPNHYHTGTYWFGPGAAIDIDSKGQGTHTFNVTAKTKDWGSQGDFKVSVSMWDCSWHSLDSDQKILTFL